MSLKIAFKNTSASTKNADPVFRKSMLDLLEETRTKQRIRAEKKYGVKIDQIKTNFK